MHDNVSRLDECKIEIVRSLTNTVILHQFFDYEKENQNFKMDSGVVKKIYLVDLAGQKKSLFEIIEENKKKVTYIDFWATWCGPCLYEIPYLGPIKKRFDDSVNIVTISLDLDFKKWKKYADKITFLVQKYCVEDSVSESRLRNLLDMDKIPRSVLLGKDGKVESGDALSPSTQNGIISQIENLLRGETEN